MSPSLGICQSPLVRPGCAADSNPRHTDPGHPQYARHILESVRALEAVSLQYTNVVERDVPVLQRPLGDLPFHLSDHVARGTSLDDETLDLLVSHVASPDHNEVTEGGIPDPALLAVKNPGVSVAPTGGGDPARDSRSNVGLGQAECADDLPLPHPGQPLLLLLLRSAEQN